MERKVRGTELRNVLKKASDGKYGVAMVNAYNLEWVKAIVFSAQQTRSPVMVGVNHEAAVYMGGYEAVVALVTSLVKASAVDVPVFIHLDHGDEQACRDALAAGFDSVMYDGSKLPIAQNIAKSKELLALAKEHGACFEAEVGTIGGKEDSVVAGASFADVDECVAMANIGVDLLAVGIGNVHGRYPPGWPGLNLDLLAEVAKRTGSTPLVLHGSSWVPNDQVTKAVADRVCKVNVSSELKDAFANATIEYIKAGKCVGKGEDPRKLLQPGYEAIKALLVKKYALFGSSGKA